MYKIYREKIFGFRKSYLVYECSVASSNWNTKFKNMFIMLHVKTFFKFLNLKAHK